jgi:AcrR family transcriptional regulator
MTESYKVNVRSIYTADRLCQYKLSVHSRNKMRKANPELQSRRRQEIVDAATACFIANGFHQTSMVNISEAAGLSMGLLYRYFPSKTAIIDAVASRDRDEMIAAIAALPEAGETSFAAGWTDLIVELVLELSAPGTVELLNEIYAEAGRNGALMQQVQRDDGLLLAAAEAKLTAQLVANPPGVAMILVSLIEGLTVRCHLAPGTARAALRHVVALAVNSLVPG